MPSVRSQVPCPACVEEVRYHSPARDIWKFKQETKVFISPRHSKRQICELDWIQTQTEGGGGYLDSNWVPCTEAGKLSDSNTPPPVCIQIYTDIHYGNCSKRASHWASLMPRLKIKQDRYWLRKFLLFVLLFLLFVIFLCFCFLFPLFGTKTLKRALEGRNKRKQAFVLKGAMRRMKAKELTSQWGFITVQADRQTKS